MTTPKPTPGDAFPKLVLPRLGGGELALGTASSGYAWQLIIVYRGKHCPICTRYLREVEEVTPDLNAMGIEVVAISADSEERATAQIAEAGATFPVGYGLTVEQMKSLGLYISSPRHGIDAEGPFAEPAVFVVNESAELRMVDIANVPFIRPQLSSLVGGLRFMRGMTTPFPANGTYAA